MRLLMSMLLIGLLAGCGSARPGGERPIYFSTDEARYAPGEEVQLELDNRSPETIGYNLCFSELERETDQGWERLPSDEVCTMIQYGLEPGDTASFTKELGDLPAGRYRFSTDVELRESGGRESLATQPFAVE